MIHDPGISAACDPDTRRTASTRTRFVRGCKPGGRRGPGLWQQPEPPLCHKVEGPRCRNARFEHTLSASTPPNHDIVISGGPQLGAETQSTGLRSRVASESPAPGRRARGPVAPKLAARLNCGLSSPSYYQARRAPHHIYTPARASQPSSSSLNAWRVSDSSVGRAGHHQESRSAGQRARDAQEY
ncbi:hypothetical protein OH76DRAFT_294208 [Lentinus brumalis]|uniref:Uncharacterized protein n=1 Tax=Lentinus brumalis TaxID=2498619 RepID=A0A371DFZ6_9APHY|nr:hypothetical protein OH76DRAFT_294208 [Polyporus brumalis]